MNGDSLENEQILTLISRAFYGAIVMDAGDFHKLLGVYVIGAWAHSRASSWVVGPTADDSIDTLTSSRSPYRWYPDLDKTMTYFS